MNIKCLVIFLALIVAVPRPASSDDKPKLVIVFVLDQFPFEYLDRCQPWFVKNGFRYLLEHGANFTNTRYEYAWTKTAAGHAAIATGAYGHLNGIPVNNWYDRRVKKVINAVEDSTVRIIPGTYMGSGRSPRNMKAYTIGDMLRLQTGFRSRVISVSNKDRAAVLLAGKFGSAFWLDHGKLVTSTFYNDTAGTPFLRFVDSTVDLASPYFGKIWNELEPAAAAAVCDEDDRPFEFSGLGLGRTFPHPVTGDNATTMTPSFYNAFDHSPFAAELLLSIARTFITKGEMGRRTAPDMLFIGISSMDEIGHQYGPASHETFDGVLRIDRYLRDFFSFLDSTIGLKNCCIALSSDHGVAPIPEYLQNTSRAVRSGRITSGMIAQNCSRILRNVYGNTTPSADLWIEKVIESEITLDGEAIRSAGRSIHEVENILSDSLPDLPFVAAVVTRDQILSGTESSTFGRMVERSFDPERCGDVMVILRPYYIMSGETTGTNHGQPYSYDSHVPMIIAGGAFQPGIYAKRAQPVDLAPTLARALGCEFPPVDDGRVLEEALRAGWR